MRLKSVAIVSHLDMNIFLFRAALIKRLVERGVKTRVIVPAGEYARGLRDLGAVVEHYPLARGSMNPLRVPAPVLALRRLLAMNPPQIAHSFTHQPNILVRLAASKKTRVVNSVTGLGSCFYGSGAKGRIRAAVFRTLYRATAGRCRALVFQNPNDRDFFLNHKMTGPASTHLIQGSGVDLERFRPGRFKPEEITRARRELGIEPGHVVLTLCARLIRDKGVFEFLQAARDLTQDAPMARFLLVGAPDPGNPGSLGQDEMAGAARSGNVIFAGWRKDMDLIWGLSDVAVLPSYGEGLPVTLQEAMASGLPVVTTDVPGCRQIVGADGDEKHGLLVPSKDWKALSLAMRDMIRSSDMRYKMGANARNIAEIRFNAARLADETIGLYENEIL